MKYSTIFGTLITIAMAASPASANDDFVQGLIGGIVGAAIANGANAKSTRPRRSSSSGVSSAQRTENKEVQTALNYYGFNAGTPDGVFGSKTRQAVSQYQACLGYSITGKLNSFEKQFLKDSYFKSLAAGNETLRLVASKPNGYCGVLQDYLTELTKPVEVEPVKPTLVPTPATPVIQSTEVNNVNIIDSSNSNYSSINVSITLCPSSYKVGHQIGLSTGGSGSFV